MYIQVSVVLSPSVLFAVAVTVEAALSSLPEQLKRATKAVSTTCIMRKAKAKLNPPQNGRTTRLYRGRIALLDVAYLKSCLAYFNHLNLSEESLENRN